MKVYAPGERPPPTLFEVYGRFCTHLVSTINPPLFLRSLLENVGREMEKKSIVCPCCGFEGMERISVTEGIFIRCVGSCASMWRVG